MGLITVLLPETGLQLGAGLPATRELGFSLGSIRLLGMRASSCEWHASYAESFGTVHWRCIGALRGRGVGEELGAAGAPGELFPLADEARNSIADGTGAVDPLVVVLNGEEREYTRHASEALRCLARNKSLVQLIIGGKSCWCKKRSVRNLAT